MDGTVTNGLRASCTSIEVVDAANRILNRIVELVQHIAVVADTLPELVESRGGTVPNELKLDVVQAGDVAILREESTAIEFVNDGHTFGVYQRAEPVTARRREPGAV